MAMNRPCAWLVAYDIRDARRLARLHRFLRREATPIQYSVFMLRASPTGAGNLAKAIEGKIDRGQDDVRIYRIPEPAQVFIRGRSMLPDGVDLLGPGASLLHGA
ncbi:MAG: CRISPR-associated endonuclease Cas2 [Gammaproteobacteria bacterium]|nr:CRISPR-associated endonuclease Cas2 [Gammaproteobacteria bacterium]